MTQDLLDWFDYSNGLTPELYFKYIVFLVLLLGMCRLLGEMINNNR